MAGNPPTLKLLKEYSQKVSNGMCERIPLETICSTMVANNRILAAAILESGGKLVISSDSLYEILTSVQHVMATANSDESITLTVVRKEDIDTQREMLPL